MIAGRITDPTAAIVPAVLVTVTSDTGVTIQTRTNADGHYVLAPGGNPARGRDRYAVSCADCHGEDGRFMPIDGSESLGSVSRSSAYEVWFKMLNGQPGTDMRRQIVDTSSADQEQAILDVLAALCDRKAFPPMAGSKDVPDADPRCSAYLR